MKIIISPAKRMKEDPDSMPVLGRPMFLPKTQQLYTYLKSLSCEQLQALMACNDKIAAQNYQRYQTMDQLVQRTPALFAYQGIQYQYMGPTAFTDQQYAYLQEHLCILSGFYGLLRPFDGIFSYRLEMQAKLKTDFCENLYDFWGDDLGGELSRDNGLVLDLASEEYSKAARQGLSPAVRWVTVRFGEVQKGKFREKGTQVKMARGAMVRYLAEHAVTRVEEICGFQELGYHFDQARSAQDVFVFTKV